GGFTHGMTRGFPSPGGRHGDDGLKIGREGLGPIQEFLDYAKQESKPFFIWYAPFLPHAPHTPPARLLEHYQRQAPSLPIAKYWAMCEWFDETCGALLNELDQRGLRDNTIVIYVTDNGWINLADRSAYAPRSKRSPNEGGIRTPIMLRWPNRIAPEMNVTTCVSSLDIAPTILQLCGQPVPDSLPGIDLTNAESL
ncbi:MAG: sulfatase-like hydrolase/transferase, partial [Planctomycetaceae bacterium]|nr:sulfatase-like hydrolase/transferase [Planctomycetaceae bacterium]